MNASPLITIGITCYNAADTIIAALHSAAAQTWPNLEIVVVDDCSSDGSAAVVAAHLTTLVCPARLIRHEKNQGVAAARNTILAHANGELIAFFDDDDTSHPDRLRVQYERLISYERANRNALVACFASVRRSYPNGYAPVFTAIGARDIVPVGDDLTAYHLYGPRRTGVFYGNGTPCLSLMIRTEVLRQIGGFDPALRRNEDGEMAIRLGLAGGAAVGCPEILVEQTASGGEDKRPEFSLASDLYIIEKYRDVLEKTGQYGYARTWAYMKYHHHAGHRIRAAFILVRMVLCYPRRTLVRFLRRAPLRLLHEWHFSRSRGRA